MTEVESGPTTWGHIHETHLPPRSQTRLSAKALAITEQKPPCLHPLGFSGTQILPKQRQAPRHADSRAVKDELALRTECYVAARLGITHPRVSKKWPS